MILQLEDSAREMSRLVFECVDLSTFASFWSLHELVLYRVACHVWLGSCLTQSGELSSTAQQIAVKWLRDLFFFLRGCLG